LRNITVTALAMPFELGEKPTPRLYSGRFHKASPTIDEHFYSDHLEHVGMSILPVGRS